jgi:adenylate cyclase
MKYFKKILLSPWTALVTLALVVGIRVADPAFVESVRLRYFDTLITAKAPTKNNIVTVNIDEATLDQYGQWPLPRDRYARLIQDLYQRGAGLVIFNVLMAEPDRQGKDASLARMLEKYPVILPNVPGQKTKNQPRPPGSAVLGPEYLDRIITYPGMIANRPELERSAAGIGTVNTLPEIDGVNRRIPLIATIDGRLYPSLSMETLRVLADDTTVQVKLNELGVEKMRIPKFGPITTDNLGRIWIDWSQHSRSVSAVDLPQDFAGAVVIVGVTAAGIGNPVPTAVGSIWPSDVQARVIATMINGVTIQRPDWADGAEILTLAVLGVILLFLTRWTYAGILFGITGVVGSVAVSHYLFSQNLWLGDGAYIAGALVLVMLHAYGVKFVAEYLAKLQIKRQFGTYLSPDLVAQLQRNPELLVLGGESRQLSIMFTDVRGFTTISEHYGRDVQGLTRIMNRYMTAMTKRILENKGTLDKYIGDAQMAFWNAPLDNAEHARDAVRTALEMMVSLDEFNQEIAKEGIPEFGMGLGINTDTVVVGNMGSDQRFDYTCLGDGVNLASRLEGQSKGYGVKIVLGKTTAELVKDEYEVFELDCIAVKGKTEGVYIYTVAPESNQHREFLELYYAGDWDRALAQIPLCKNVCPEMEKYYDAMEQRLVSGKPSDWTGIYRATTK